MHSFTVSRYFSLAIVAGLSIVCFVPTPGVVTLFSSDLVARAIAALDIQIVSVADAARALNLVVSAGLNVLRSPFHATGLSIPNCSALQYRWCFSARGFSV